MITEALSNVRAVIFDMDGTMVDNMMVHHRAWQVKLRELGMDLPLEEIRAKVHGINEEILERLFGEQLTPDERRRHSFEKEKAYREIFKDSLVLVEGLDIYLEEIRSRGIKMAIGSAAPPENVDFVLDTLQIRHLFDAILHARNVKKGKPDPEIYLSLMEILGFSPSEVLIFEDSPVGAEAAVRSGARTIVINTTHEKEEFDHLPEIIGFIRNFKC
ncbi:MAG: HAD family hydrolase [Cyclobacteriaceae bacterium]